MPATKKTIGKKVSKKLIQLLENKSLNLKSISLFLMCIFLVFSCSADLDDKPELPKEPPPPPAVTVPFPEAMYMQNGCGSCHGEEGDGRGSRSDLIGKTRMPNFQERSSYAYGHSIGEIAKTIKNGIPGGYMKSYSYMRQNEIQALAQYIHSMQKK